jgi:methylthioribose-1-phosphate isomerase
MPVPHPSPISGASYSAAELMPGDEVVLLLEQRRLPVEETYVELRDAASVAEAITTMVVRGAPAIGIAAAYGLAVEARRVRGDAAEMKLAAGLMARARPTAVNLRWAVDRMMKRVADGAEAMAEEARSIHREDVAACRAMGALGAKHLRDGATVLTHCNAGALATGGYGTALGVIRAAHEQGKKIRVLSCETRPYLQGARLTCWELSRDGIPVELVTDGMSAHFFGRGVIDAVVVGADRIARNGDVANKIGTYAHACLASMHDRPFFVAAPRSTLDPETASGDAIVIEERSSEEVVRIAGTLLAPEGVRARHPAFDVTPARLVTRLFTESFECAGPETASWMAH